VASALLKAAAGDKIADPSGAPNRLLQIAGLGDARAPDKPPPADQPPPEKKKGLVCGLLGC